MRMNLFAMFQNAMLQKLMSDNFLSQEERLVACSVTFFFICLIVNFDSVSKNLDYTKSHD